MMAKEIKLTVSVSLAGGEPEIMLTVGDARLIFLRDRVRYVRHYGKKTKPQPHRSLDELMEFVSNGTPEDVA